MDHYLAIIERDGGAGMHRSKVLKAQLGYSILTDSSRGQRQPCRGILWSIRPAHVEIFHTGLLYMAGFG